MITLSKSGNSVTFTFDENSGYLQNGTIDVPINSLALIIDESDMATFRKAASNDIFVSARYEEFGMSKAELEAWYKANMVGSTGGGVDSGTVQTMIDESISGKVDTSVYTAYTAATDERIAEDEEVTAAGLNALNESLNGKADTTAVTEAISAATDDMATKTWVGEQGYLTEHQSLSAYSTTEEVNSAITEATSGKVDTSTFETYSGSVETALSGKQDTLSAGTNITISGNVISAEGGGKAIEAGRGISITTGATADTVSFNLPISAGTGTNSIVAGHTDNKASGSYSHAEGKSTVASGSWGSHAEGASTTASGSYSHAEGSDTKANGFYSHAEGYYTIASGQSEHASGQYNVSNKATTTFGDSGNTLFSVGNGTANDARHNAFEIRQNGDIYCSDGTNDVKLQDYLQIKAVKVTQAEYDALVQGGTVDANTLYIITNVVS